MKGILRHVIYYGISLAILPVFLSGIEITGGFQTYLLAGIILTILYYIIKPIVSIISFPLTLVSGGLLTFLINTLILYLMTIFLSQVDIGETVLRGFSLWGVSATNIHLNRLLSYLFCSAIMTLFMGISRWLNE